jgi:putative protein-disulfide isomerase
MCSWCWGFTGVLAEVEPRLNVPLELVLGGLAPDDDRPMPEAMRRYVQDAWRSVAALTGARFEHAFWERNQPRRSTWPACRAVLAAGERGREMFAAIQRAYYLEARDPSDRDTLVALGTELGFDREAFANAIDAPQTHSQLDEHFALRDRMGVSGYPSLAFDTGEAATVLTRGWVDADTLHQELTAMKLLEPTS